MNLKKILAFIMICIFITGCSKSSVQGDWVLLSLEQMVWLSKISS